MGLARFQAEQCQIVSKQFGESFTKALQFIERIAAVLRQRLGEDWYNMDKPVSLKSAKFEVCHNLEIFEYITAYIQSCTILHGEKLDPSDLVACRSKLFDNAEYTQALRIFTQKHKFFTLMRDKQEGCLRGKQGRE